MKVYLDACCYNRPFDDQNQEKIRLETISITFIFNRIDSGKLQLVTSDILELELLKNHDEFKRYLTLELLAKSSENTLLDEIIFKRAKELEQMGFKAFDSLHVAISEHAGAEVLLTTDNKMIVIARKFKNKLKIRVINPLDFIKENF